MQFLCPASLVISGVSGSGKSKLLYEILKCKNTLFSKPISKILYCYGIWSESYEEMENTLDGVTLHQGLPNQSDIEEFVDGTNCLLALDDMMDLVVKDQYIQSLFFRGCHHMPLNIVYINQNIFSQGKVARSINLNSHYIILTRNDRCWDQLSVLGKQLGMRNTLIESYRDAMKTPFNYIVIILSPYHHEDYKIVTNIFNQQETIAYIPG